jgi:hypothetical protein
LGIILQKKVSKRKEVLRGAVLVVIIICVAHKRVLRKLPSKGMRQKTVKTFNLTSVYKKLRAVLVYIVRLYTNITL